MGLKDEAVGSIGGQSNWFGSELLSDGLTTNSQNAANCGGLSDRTCCFFSHPSNGGDVHGSEKLQIDQIFISISSCFFVDPFWAIFHNYWAFSFLILKKQWHQTYGFLKASIPQRLVFLLRRNLLVVLKIHMDDQLDIKYYGHKRYKV